MDAAYVVEEYTETENGSTITVSKIRTFAKEYGYEVPSPVDVQQYLEELVSKGELRKINQNAWKKVEVQNDEWVMLENKDISHNEDVLFYSFTGTEDRPVFNMYLSVDIYEKYGLHEVLIGIGLRTKAVKLIKSENGTKFTKQKGTNRTKVRISVSGRRVKRMLDVLKVDIGFKKMFTKYEVKDDTVTFKD